MLRILKYCSLILLLLFYMLFLAHPIDLTSADLGRHLVNGRIFVETGKIPQTNLYSYTEPDYPTINHHWLGGVAFYVAQMIGGFTGVWLLFAALSLVALYLFWRLAEKAAGWPLATVVGLIVVPLLAERTEVRPEVFSYLFCGLLLTVLPQIFGRENYKGTPGKFWVGLSVLVGVQLFWVNTHIYFFLGPVLVGLFTCQYLLKVGCKKAGWISFLPIILVSLVCLVNPAGLSGLLAPLTIFKNYGYRVAENMSVWFMDRLSASFNLTYFKVIFGIFGFLGVAGWLKKRNANFVIILLGLIASVMGWVATRNFGLFGLLILEVMANQIGSLDIKKSLKDNLGLSVGVTYLSLLVVLITAIFGLQQYFPYWSGYGVGLKAGNLKAIDFIKDNNLKGPIFNNYDIGGYLIYGLYPSEKVFVDNRPEAYSVDFFQRLYIPMQEKDKVWQEALKKYDFNLVVFFWHDLTPWGQSLLKSRLADSEWVPVFADDRALVMVRDTKANQVVIKQFRIPNEKFVFR